MTAFFHSRGGGPWRAELRATVRLALPLVFTQLAQISIMTTDVLMMGWLGPDDLAAGALGSNIYFVVLVCGWGVMMAVAPMVAQAVGRGRGYVRDARRSLRQGLWAALAIGLPGMAVLWHTEGILRLTGQEPANAAAAGAYVRAMLWGFVASNGFMLLRSFVSALERPRPALAVMVLTLAANAGGNYMLMFGKAGFPALGLVGAGIASAGATWLGFLLLLGFVLVDRRLRRFHLLGRFWRPDWTRFAELFRIGAPIAAIMLLEVSVFVGAVQAMGWIGTAEIAAHQIALQFAAVTFMVPLGLSQAATVRVGLAAGAGDGEGVRRAGWTAFALGVGFMAAMAVVMWVMPRTLIGLFLDPDRPVNAHAMGLAVTFLAFAALFQVFDGAQAVALGALRGLKDTRVPALYAAFGYWAVGAPLGLVLAFGAGRGGVGIWWGLTLGLVVVAALATTRFARREKLGLVPRLRAG